MTSKRNWKEYYSRPEVKTRRKAWRQSKRGKELQKKYDQTERRKIRRLEYSRLPKTKELQREYDFTPEAIIRRREYAHRPEIKKKLNLYSKQYNQQPDIKKYHAFKEREHRQRLRLGRMINDTQIERLIQEELSKKEYGFYRHYSIIGKPDIAFPDKKIAIFCDGDYWHANPNIYSACHKFHSFIAEEKWKRDRYVSDELKKLGWVVLRFWETDIRNNTKDVIERIETRLRDEAV